MDLATLDTRKGGESGFTFDLLHPKSGEPTGATITVRGSDSDTYQEKFRECQRRRLNTLAKNNRAGMNTRQIELDALELLAACTAGWSGIEENGASMPFNEANVRSVYERFPWIREQVDAAVHERGNFLPNSAKS